MGDGFTVIGMEKLQKKLRKNVSLNEVKKVVKINGAEMQAEAKRNADFKGHYEGKKFIPPTGTLRRSIGLEMTDGGMTAEVEPHTEYASYVEFGTRFMEAQPYMKPAFEKQSKQFRKDMNELVR